MLRNNKFNFVGEGTQYFGILISNLFLIIVTLTIYVPWAFVKERKFLVSNLSLSGKPFSYSGEGKDLIKGYLIALVIYMVVIVSANISMGLYGIGLLGIILIGIPYLIHELIKYDSTHTHWSEKTFEYTGDRTAFIKLAAINILLSIITLGIYGPWARVAITKYITQNLKIGKLGFDFEGEGLAIFLIVLKGMFLTIITLGIYSFWFIKDLSNYLSNKMIITQDGKRCSYISTLTAGDIFKMVFVGCLIIIVTLGIGIAWVEVRNIKIFLSKLEIEESFDPDNV